MENKKLTFLEAASIVTGYGIGGGIMAVPYLASLSGIIPMLVLFFAAFGASLIFHMMTAEIMLRDGESAQIIELFNKYMFRGKYTRFILWFLFAVIVLSFIASLSAFIAGGGENLNNLFPSMPLWAGHCIVYFIAAGVVFFGLKAIGISEKYGVAAMIAFVIILLAASVRHGLSFNPGVIGPFKYQTALFGMLMFSFFALFSVPQVVTGLSWNRKLIPKAVAFGMALNGLVILMIVLICMGTSATPTRFAMNGLANALGGWVKYFSSLFVLLAMLTTYWSVSFALSVVVQERLGWGQRISWLVATLPSFIIVISKATDFLGFMQIAGGTIAILIVIMMIPMYTIVKKKGAITEPEWQLGFFGKPVFQAIVLIAFLLMAAGSLVKVD
jgi:amino acid permease